MGILKRKEKKELEPQYYTSATNIQTVNYKVYYMSKKEKIFYFLLAFAVGALVGYLFYGGLAKDEFSQPTRLTYILNCTIMLIVGIVAGEKFFFQYEQSRFLKNEKICLPDSSGTCWMV